MTVVEAIERCRLCGSGAVSDLLDLGLHALSGLFPRVDAPDPVSVPLVLCRCSGCGLVQLRHSTDQNEMFTHEYGYRSDLNASMKAHLKELVDWTMHRARPQDGDAVLDIGCNDGTLLAACAAPGLELFGIDPIVGKFIDEYPDDVIVHEGFFTSKAAGAFLNGRRMKVITSVAMFYDLPEPDDFIAGIKSTLAEQGVWVFEQSYLVSMLKACAFDSICHEHLEYWTLQQVEPLLGRHGLRLFDGEENDANGGSFRLAACHADASFSETAALASMRQIENDMRLDTPAPFDAFKAKINKLAEQTHGLIERLNAEGKRVYAYGASTKGNTLLQYYGLDSRHIKAAVEVNPEKFGRHTPGTHVPIIPEAECMQQGVDYFLVLPWHFREDILSRAQRYLDAGIKFIFPLPQLEIVE